MRFELRHDYAIIAYEDTGQALDASSELVARAYFSGGSVDLGLLPPAVRWVSADGLGVILERPPQEIVINYKEDLFTFCLPWTVWGIRLSPKRKVESSYLFGRPYPLAFPSDELYAFPLPNMSNKSEVALPSKPHVQIGPSLMHMIDAFWERPFTGAFNEILADKIMVPDEWIPSLEEGVNKYLTFLGEHDLESITFAPLKVAQVPTLDDLCIALDPTLRDGGPETAMEFLEEIVKRANQMAGW